MSLEEFLHQKMLPLTLCWHVLRFSSLRFFPKPVSLRLKDLNLFFKWFPLLNVAKFNFKYIKIPDIGDLVP